MKQNTSKATVATKTAKVVVTKKTAKAEPTKSTRHQRNMVREARAFTGKTLAAFVKENLDHLKIVAGEENRKKLSAEATKLISR